LRLEASTPTEIDKAIVAFEQENQELCTKLQNIEGLLQKMYQKVSMKKLKIEKLKK
jgi:hypothetical protein